jgi:hypothetical protein
MRIERRVQRFRIQKGIEGAISMGHLVDNIRKPSDVVKKGQTAGAGKFGISHGPNKLEPVSLGC